MKHLKSYENNTHDIIPDFMKYEKIKPNINDWIKVKNPETFYIEQPYVKVIDIDNEEYKDYNIIVILQSKDKMFFIQFFEDRHIDYIANETEVDNFFTTEEIKEINRIQYEYNLRKSTKKYNL